MQSANHTFILVISTPTVLYNTSLVWLQCIAYYLVYSHWRKHLALQEFSNQAFNHGQKSFRDKCALTVVP